MKILTLADIHISKNTPWSTDYEDIRYLCRQLYRLPDDLSFDACIVAGDIFNVSRIKPEDVFWFIKILNLLGVYNKGSMMAIGGNHDPHDPSIASCIPCGHTLSPQSVLCFDGLSVSGMMYSPDLDKVREYLNNVKTDIVVCHQSVEEFAGTFGLAGANQLKLADFPKDRLCIVGDTHITKAIQHGSGAVLSPGILCPMRSRAELLDSEPHLVWFDTEDGIQWIPLKKRFAAWFDGDPESIEQFENHLKEMEDWEPDMIMYVSESMREGLPKRLPERTRVMIVPAESKENYLEMPEVDVDDFEGTGAYVIEETVSGMLDEADDDRSTIVSLVRDIAVSETPEDQIKHYLQGEDKK